MGRAPSCFVRPTVQYLRGDLLSGVFRGLSTDRCDLGQFSTLKHPRKVKIFGRAADP